MPLYVIVFLIALLVIGYLIWKWMQNNVGMQFQPENFEFVAVKSTRNGDKLTTTFKLVPKVKGADPKKFKVDITPKVPDGKLTKGTIIGNATITQGTDNKDNYTVTFPIAQKNAINPGENYAINVNDGSPILKQAGVPEVFPVEISSVVDIPEGSTNEYFLLEVDLQYNYGETPISGYKVEWIPPESDSPYDGQLLITKSTIPVNWPMTIQVPIQIPDEPTTYSFIEWHKYSDMGLLVDGPKPPPTDIQDPRL